MAHRRGSLPAAVVQDPLHAHAAEFVRFAAVFSGKAAGMTWSARSIRTPGYRYEHMFPSALIQRIATGLLEVADAALRPLDDDGHEPHLDHSPRAASAASEAVRAAHGRTRQREPVAAARRPGSAATRPQPCASPLTRRGDRPGSHRTGDRADAR
jgi:hypothetical protein